MFKEKQVDRVLKILRIYVYVCTYVYIYIKIRGSLERHILICGGLLRKLGAGDVAQSEAEHLLPPRKGLGFRRQHRRKIGYVWPVRPESSVGHGVTNTCNPVT